MTDVGKASALVAAIHEGDVDSVRRLLREDLELVSWPLGGRQGTRTPLHVVADWPGTSRTARRSCRSDRGGRRPERPRPRERAETPLHWAASSDDVDVARALIDGGADLEAADGSIGTPLDNAIGYGCWHVARLPARGAKVDALWHAAALGDLTRVRELLAERPASEPDELSQAFWHACAGGQRRAAELLLQHGADLNWVPDYADGTPLDAASGQDTRRENVITWLRNLGARSADDARPSGA